MPSARPRLSSRQHPVVRAFREAARDRAGSGRVLLDGAHLIREALRARVPVRTVLVSARFLDAAPPADRAVPSAAEKTGAVVYDVTDPVIDAASPVRASTGIVALADWTPAPLSAVFHGRETLALALVDVQDPGNVGAVIRSADALGATGVVSVGTSAYPGAWKTLRGAMGGTFRLPVARATMSEVLDAARQSGATLVASVAADARLVSDVDWRQPVLVLLGNEGAGLSAAIVSAAGERVTVPMREGVDSLNVAVTASLILYEARRQRGARPQSKVRS